jgi:hypothetical protein
LKDPTYQTYIKQEKEKEQVGGYDSEKMNQVQKSLDFLLSDSFHDFGKGRNPYFPSIIYRNAFIDMKYEKIKALTKNIYHGTYHEKDHPDVLHDYLLGSKFEEQVKVDFLTGELVGDIPDISYFFSDAPPMDWPSKRLTSIKDAVTGDAARTNIARIIGDNSVGGNWYYIYDACVPSRIRANIGGKQALTLAKIWDPSTASKISKKELFESTHKETSLISEGTYSQVENGHRISYTIFDWNMKEKSLYDKIYGDLLHLETIPNKSLIQLRLAVSDENKCSVGIKIGDKYFIIDSGFSVNELSAGLYYAEMSPNDYRQDIQQKTDKIRRDYLPPDMKTPTPYRIQKLVEIIDELKNQKMSKEQIISTLLRFKSSGDHGQSKMCQIINNKLKEYCMFVSGDNLACVEAISLLDIPVLMRYYSQSSSSNDDDENEEEEPEARSETCKVEGSFFLCLYLPTGNNLDKVNSKIAEQVDRIQELLPYWVADEVLPDRVADEVLPDRVDEVLPGTRKPSLYETVNTLNKNIEEFFQSQFDSSVEEQRDKLLKRAYAISNMQIEDLKKPADDIEEGKKRLSLLKSFADNLYLLYYWQTGGFQNIYNESSLDKTILEPFDAKLDAVTNNLKRKRIEYPTIISTIIQQFNGRATINMPDLYSVDELSKIREQLKVSFERDVSRLKSVFSLDDGNMKRVESIVQKIKNDENERLLAEIETISVKGIGFNLKNIIEQSLLNAPTVSFSVTVPTIKKPSMSMPKKIAKAAKAARRKPSKIRPTTNVTRRRQPSKTRAKATKTTRKTQSLPKNVPVKKSTQKRTTANKRTRPRTPTPGSRSNSYQSQKVKRTRRTTIV